LVFLSGLEEGLFPHSRTMLVPDDIEEERRLCYVGMTRAMDQLILTRAVYRRRYGNDMPQASVPSRFLDEVPAPLLEELGPRRQKRVRRRGGRRPAVMKGIQGARTGAAATRNHRTIPTRTKPRAHPGGVRAVTVCPLGPRSGRRPPSPTTRLRILPNFSPAAA